jgi:hypothetical protein
MRSIWFRAFLAVVTVAGAGAALAQGVDPEFKPVLVAAEVSAREVRPGDPFTVTFRFRNAGTRPALSDYYAFTHIESPTADCEHIVVHADHQPAEATTTWQPGREVVDGPIVLQAPELGADQDCFIHVGIYDSRGGGQRLLDTYDGGKIRVSLQAPAVGDIGPEPLPADEVARRRAALVARLPAGRCVSLETLAGRFDLDRESAAWALTDRQTGVVWTSSPLSTRFGEIALANGPRRFTWAIERFDEIESTAAGLRLVSRPVIDGIPCGTTVEFRLSAMTEPAGVRLAYRAQVAGPWQVRRVRVLDKALMVTGEEKGSLYVPQRLGLEQAAATGLPSRQAWPLYSALSMAMCGAVKDGSALLLNWDVIDSELVTHGEWLDAAALPGRRQRSVSLDLAGPEGVCSLHPLGRGGYVEIATAYRPLAKAKGWRLTWAEKRAQWPTVDRIFGATDFKPFVLSRILPTSRFAQNGKEQVNLSYTFDEVAQCAEHWRRDLQIDRAFVVLAGWINGGYDVRHPDVLPAAPECGGDAGLQAAAARIKACGYLFGLHDNYQDLYPDAASWDLKWINKDAKGEPKQGGNWAGGQAWQVCAIQQVALAARPTTNLPEIARLFSPGIYFIDTVFAWPLVTCEDPVHPMTLADDLAWKSKLCLLSKQHCGLFGSEEGREWAVPCADYQEGIFGQQLHAAPGEVIPLFPLVYSDCVQLMGHQGDRFGAGDEKPILDHVLFAEMLLPQFGPHLYWQRPEGSLALPVTPLAPQVKDLGGRKFELTLPWQVNGAVPADLRVFVHFTHRASTHPEQIAYQSDHQPAVPSADWAAGTVVADGPFTVTVPPEFNGPAEIRVGFLSAGGERLALANLRGNGGRYLLGTVTVAADGITCTPATPVVATEIWSRGDAGWGAGLSPTDRVIKNTWEVLSPLNLITAERPLDSHEFVSADRSLQRTRFGDLTVTVSYGKEADIGANRVPAYGFVIESPTFVAFCATRYNGIDYATPTLFTARSLDGKPIAESAQVRVYHGFGEPRLRLGARTFEVPREAVVAVTP